MAMTATLVACPFAARADARSDARREAERAVQLSNTAGRQLLGLLDASRRAGDAREMRCVDTALTQVNSFARTLEARRARVDAIAGAEDARALEVERRVIRTLVAQLRARAAAGHACVTEQGPEGGGTVVITIIEDGTPEEDVSRPGWCLIERDPRMPCAVDIGVPPFAPP